LVRLVIGKLGANGVVSGRTEDVVLLWSGSFNPSAVDVMDLLEVVGLGRRQLGS
jgi:hypothetical protein